MDFRMKEWGMAEQPPRLQSCVRKALCELDGEALLRLKDPRLEVMVIPESSGMGFVWPYFPIHKHRSVVKQAIEFGQRPKTETRVLLVLTAPDFETQPAPFLDDCLRDALGHVLLYLRAPKARNECSDAMNEWRASIRRSAKVRSKYARQKPPEHR